MPRSLALVLLFLLVTAVLPLGVAGAQTGPGDTTTTTPAAPEGGTSPWVLVLIGVAGGAVAGVFTGLARRRRAEREAHSAPGE